MKRNPLSRRLEFEDKKQEQRYYLLKKRSARVAYFVLFLALTGMGLLLTSGIGAGVIMLLLGFLPTMVVSKWNGEMMEIYHSDGVHVVEF